MNDKLKITSSPPAAVIDTITIGCVSYIRADHPAIKAAINALKARRELIDSKNGSAFALVSAIEANALKELEALSAEASPRPQSPAPPAAPDEP